MGKTKDKFDWSVIVFILAIIAAYNFFGHWGSIVVLVIGLPVLGWSKRHSGPLPTNKNKADDN